MPGQMVRIGDLASFCLFKSIGKAYFPLFYSAISLTSTVLFERKKLRV